MLTPGIKDVVNRPNHAGTTPLHEACRTGDSWKVFLLWNAGAEPLNDKNGEKPKLQSHVEKYAPCDMNGAPFRPLPSQKLGIQHVLDYKSIEMDPLFKAWDPSKEHGEPEKKILRLFERLGVNVLSVATDDMNPADKVAEKIRGWNSGHDQKCKLTAKQFIAPKASAEGACILSKKSYCYGMWLVTVMKCGCKSGASW